MRRWVTITTTLLALSAATIGISGEESRSAAAASMLTALLDQKKLDAVAARSLDRPDRFIAALYFPGSQLLVVSSTYPAGAVLEQRIGNGDYREAYLDLQGAGSRQGRFFVMDLQANGLRPTRSDEAFDITYVDEVKQLSFDGNWKTQKLSERDYDEAYQAQDEQYARMLNALVAQLKGTSSAPGEAPEVVR
jgi:hypothetical protein